MDQNKHITVIVVLCLLFNVFAGEFFLDVFAYAINVFGRKCYASAILIDVSITFQ